MAKSKQSRKARKQEAEKRRQQETVSPVADKPEVEAQPQVDTPAPVAEPKSMPMRKTVDFAEEYYYVYTDLRNITIVSIVMFALMFALGYFI